MDTKLHIYDFKKLYKKLNNDNPIIQDMICYRLYMQTSEIIISYTKLYELYTEAPIIYYDDINDEITIQLTCIIEYGRYVPMLVKTHNNNVYYSLLYDKKYFFDIYKINNNLNYTKQINYLLSHIFPDFKHTEEYFPIKYKYPFINIDYYAILIIYNFLKKGEIKKENRRKLHTTLLKKLKYKIKN